MLGHHSSDWAPLFFQIEVSSCLYWHQRAPGGEDVFYSKAALLHGLSSRWWENGEIIRGKMACQRHDKPNRPREELSCMLVGDGAVGKTSMIISYIFNGYNTEYRQTAFDVFTGEWRLFFKGSCLLDSAIKCLFLLDFQVWFMWMEFQLVSNW